MFTFKDNAHGISDVILRSEILKTLQRRDPALSVCPSDIARAITDGQAWRPLTLRIRAALIELMRDKRIIVTRGARVLGEHELAGGTIRVRRGPLFE